MNKKTFTKKELQNAQKYFSNSSIKVESDKIIACGNFDSTNGKYYWALNYLIKQVIKDIGIEISYFHGDNRRIGENKVWATFKKNENPNEEFFFTEEDAEIIQEKIDNIRNISFEKITNK
jgi:hypothetical protein